MEALDFPEFRQYSTWEKCSCDSSSNESMVRSSGRIINFDSVKTRFLASLERSDTCAASVDALGTDHDGTIYFIEFKNGAIETNNIRNKVTESLLIYHEITHTSSRDTRKNAEFVLVYNPERVRLNAVQRKSIHMARLGHKSCPLYDLDKFHGVWVRRAYMMTAQEFAEKMAEKICV